jgi:hypothetical protein
LDLFVFDRVDHRGGGGGDGKDVGAQEIVEELVRRPIHEGCDQEAAEDGQKQEQRKNSCPKSHERKPDERIHGFPGKEMPK